MNPVTIEDVYPLAPTQEGILFHTLDDSGTGAYFVQASLALQGQLDLLAFQQAWQTLVQRHPVLRTSFHWDELEQPLQIVHSTVTLPFSVLDWRAIPEDQQDERLSAFLEDDRREGLDLNAAPLFRITLIELGADRFQLVWSLNHIILDGWSISLLYQELFTIYSGLLSGSRAALRAAPPYSRYISWLQRQDMVAAEAFWRSLLADVTNPTPLLIEQPDCAAAEQQTIVEINRFAEPGLAEGLQSFARHERITISTLLHAAWSLVLRAYSGEDVVLFGSVSSGRPDTLPEAEQIAGLLLTTLPVSVAYTPETPVRQWLARVQHQLVERRQFDYSPLVQVHGWSNIPRGQPLFDSILVFENYPLDDFLRGATGSLRCTDVKFITPTNYPLTVQVMFTPGLTFSLSYDAARFSAATAERVLDHLTTALTALISSPDARLSDLDVLPAHERQYVLTQLNATPLLPALDRSVAEYVASYAADAGRIAARAGDRSLTYAGLAARANQVAHWLLSLDLPDDARIGVFAERDLEMLIVLLACLQTGYAYIPLDPAYPDPRLQQILHDSRCAVIATTSDLDARISSLSETAHGSPIWCWDASTPELDSQPTIAPQRAVPPQAVATVFYTSGSTGQPKGVMVEQIGLLNHLWAKVNILELSATSRVAQTAAHSFDISIWQFLSALLVGGEVVIYPTELVLNPFALFSRLQTDGITILETVPTLLDALLTALDQQPDSTLHLRDLAYLISNAETLAVPLSRRWHAAFPHIPLLNTYGATECSDDTTHIVMRAPLADRTARVPVGQPIAGFQIYVVDQQLRPLPIGCPGQIAMAGVGVGQGYLGDPIKTAAAFVPNPFDASAGSRLYLTGDLGRWREDGQLDFLGRTDGQVKVRGYRIELGEVEAALVRCTGVHHAVTVVRPSAQQQLQLIGYVVGDAELTSERVREDLGRLVPRYMIPSQILILDQMPLNVNGKIDRRALPEPIEDAESGAALDAPQTPVEEIVAEVWCQVLDLPAVGRHDHFFDHGGHSLLATQVISRLRQLFGVDLPLRTIFEQPTVASLSSRIAVLRQHALNDNIPPLQPASREQPLPLSFAQQRLWIMDQLVPNSALYSMPVVVRLTGTLDRAALSTALDGLVARHESLRTRVDTVNGEPVQVIDAPAVCPLTVSDLEAVSPAERDAAV
ncbi:MAG: amino acid adenylation domain-containing protein, partial [Chloroflexi bacterium]|nr:amino acid adenylation domain-containing protein [Chloroflexota bacterium]